MRLRDRVLTLPNPNPGALRVAAEFLSTYNPGVNVYCSDPTWGNHHAIFKKAGLTTFKYRYLTKVSPFRVLFSI